MPFKKGDCANPAGRPRGTPDKRTALRELLRPHAPALVQKAVQLALDGDTTALRLCMDRLVPAYKSTSPAIPIGLPVGSLREQGEHTLKALANGDLSTDDASGIIGTLVGMARLNELDTINARLSALEQGKPLNGASVLEEEGGRHVLSDNQQTPEPDGEPSTPRA